MKPLFQYYVKTNLPDKLKPLKELANNYWWCWRNNVKSLFHYIDRDLFINSNHNPKLLLAKISQKRMEELCDDDKFLKLLEEAHSELTKYLNLEKWYNKQNPESGRIAYFSPEFGINESFPNYSGGLGVLSGDHLKSASDLGIPLIGVGLLYQEGYFRQKLSHHGWQNEVYHYNDFFNLPLELAEENGKEIHISVDLPDGTVHCRIWKLIVGTVTLILLDSNIKNNTIKYHREITNRLYGGDRETRIQQEIILGIGGIRALDKLNLKPSVVHINEGHAAFALLERTRQYMAEFNLNFETAAELTKVSSVFTTHTPVPAGNETFEIDRLDKYFNKYFPKLGISKEHFHSLGKADGSDSYKFSMTLLGLKMSAYANGVSALHGVVSRDMWKGLWNKFPSEEIPVGSVTNGIHTETWLASEIETLFTKYFPSDWKQRLDEQDIWDNVYKIPDAEIYKAKHRRRERLIDFIRWNFSKKNESYLNSFQIRDIKSFLDEDTLTIGFARRFATYKRASLLFNDMPRLSRILNNSERPIQIVIAGKAHPHDIQGKETIKEIIDKVKNYGLERKVVFIEDYDMVVGRLMVKGCDVWLNNPIRPMEASGTSGMKASLNGAINCSISDGWWDEGFNGANGYSFGTVTEYDSLDEQNIIESGELYDLLEFEISKEFYQKDDNGLPINWIKKMKSAIASLSGFFSSHRMVKEYAQKYYLPAERRFKEISENNGYKANSLISFKKKIWTNWDKLNIFDTVIDIPDNLAGGDSITAKANVFLADLDPSELKVQAYYGDWGHDGSIKNPKIIDLNLVSNDNGIGKYEINFNATGSGMFGLTFRVIPDYHLIENYGEAFRIKWA
ncbi:alpha-glucan family phosphorylase [Candidatus Kapabacteria bacterium]|nr:alpha-glucan family phosphorylase [Candidatus Kapabacteria bacterium]